MFGPTELLADAYVSIIVVITNDNNLGLWFFFHNNFGSGFGWHILWYFYRIRHVGFGYLNLFATIRRRVTINNIAVGVGCNRSRCDASPVPDGFQ